MRIRGALVAAVLLLAGACGDGPASGERSETAPTAREAPAPGTGPDAPELAEEPAAGEPVTDFTWTTTLDQDGYGYVLTVEGFVGDGHASYAMQVEPLLGSDGGEYADLLVSMAGFAVNGFADPGEGVSLSTGGAISTEGSTTVRVRGDERWYRNPWLLDEAAFAMGGAEWVLVSSGDAVVADLVTGVLGERYDDAVRRLLAAVEDGTPVEAPAPAEGSTELDRVLLSPWIGLAGPGDASGGDAVVTGDADEGEALWSEVLTYEPDGADGALRGTVRWSPGRAEPPQPPEDGDVIEVHRLSAQLAG